MIAAKRIAASAQLAKWVYDYLGSGGD